MSKKDKACPGAISSREWPPIISFYAKLESSILLRQGNSIPATHILPSGGRELFREAHAPRVSQSAPSPTGFHRCMPSIYNFKVVPVLALPQSKNSLDLLGREFGRSGPA
jgi:hypothetical protein